MDNQSKINFFKEMIAKFGLEDIAETHTTYSQESGQPGQYTRELLKGLRDEKLNLNEKPPAPKTINEKEGD